MKKLFFVTLVFALTLTIGSGLALAEPSAKATAQLGDLSVIEISGNGGEGILNEGDTGWERLFTQTVKTPNGKDLFINVSLECGITTDTKVMSKLLEKATAEAEAAVEVRVVINGVPVAVNGNDPADTDITFAKRNQQLIAEFAGDISGALSVECDEDAEGYVTGCHLVIDETLIEPETLQLILDTMSANSFNFIVPDLTAGVWEVGVEAKLSYKADGNDVQVAIDDQINDLRAQGISAARAYLGNGSVTIETVRMIKDENVIVDLQ